MREFLGKNKTWEMGLNNPLAQAAIYVWLFILCVIAITETWRRYRGPLFRLSPGKKVKLHIYKALDGAEIMLAALVVLSFAITRQPPFSGNLTLFIAICLVIVQKVAWFPSLGERAQILLSETEFRSSPRHFQYMSIEAVKIASLIFFSSSLSA